MFYLWNIILVKISNIKIKKVNEFKLLSKYFKEIIISNNELKSKLILEFCRPCINSNNYTQTYFNLIYDLGFKDVTRWFIRKFKLTEEQSYGERLLIHYCEQGDIEFIRWIIKEFNINYSKDILRSCLRDACNNCKLEVAEFLIKEFNMKYEDIENNLEFILLFTLFDKHKTFNTSVEKNRLEMLRWIIKEFDLNSKIIRDEIFHCDHITIYPINYPISNLKNILIRELFIIPE